MSLFTIDHYIKVRRQTIPNFIVNRPIFDMCREGVGRRGSSTHQCWWEQHMDLKGAMTHAQVDAGVAADEDEEDAKIP